LISREDELRGAYTRIRQSAGPVFLEALGLDDDRETLPRVAMAVRAGDEVLGSNWAVVREPLTPEKERLFVEASRLAALHLLQMRAGADGEERVVMDLVATAMEGGAASAGALARLDLDRHQLMVLAMHTPADPSKGPGALVLGQLTASRQRMARALAVHLSSTWPGTVVATLRDTVYALVPAAQPVDAEVRLERSCRLFLTRASGLGPCLIGIGRLAGSTGLPDSRADAHRALRVMTKRGSPSDVGRAADLELPALLLELQDLARAGSRRPSGAYARILDYDRDKRSFMVQTLRIWLTAGGDINEASARAHVHQNTFRYRLKRLSEVGEFELDDPDARFALELQLKIFTPEEWLERPRAT
jgi:sugar diacid utilization regulator